MKKSLLALAVLGAFAGVASAQTSVTIYGSFDAGVRNLSNTNAGGESRLTMGSAGTYNSNRIGFRGVEDLGGGMNARFVLENGFNSGTGAMAGDLFGRSAYVGVGGAWGAIDLGRQYTVAFKTIGAYDPFAYKYTGIAPAVLAAAGVRYSNDIQYTSAFSKAITVRAEYALGEVAGNTSTGSAHALGVSYNDGTLALGTAFTKRNIAGRDNNHYTVGGAYKFGAAKLFAAYTQEKQATVSVPSYTKFAWAGIAYDITPQIQATYAYYQTKVEAGLLGGANGKKDLNMIGATYALSKRTNFYAEMDLAKMSGVLRVAPASLTPQNEQTGVSIGLNHLF